jgi:hypothetical protein
MISFAAFAIISYFDILIIAAIIDIIDASRCFILLLTFRAMIDY